MSTPTREVFAILSAASLVRPSKSVLDLEALTKGGYIVAGKLNDSQIWERVSSNDQSQVMPPNGAIPAEDQAVLQKWIEGGASPFPPDAPGPRPIVTLQAMYAAIEKDLRTYPPEDQANLRYFSLTHLHNNPGVSDRDLRMFRAALAKLVNSLSWEPDIVHGCSGRRRASSVCAICRRLSQSLGVPAT